MDLLVLLAKELNFTYDVHLVDDNNYGSYERVSLSLSEKCSGGTSVKGFFWGGQKGAREYFRGKISDMCAQSVQKCAIFAIFLYRNYQIWSNFNNFSLFFFWWGKQTREEEENILAFAPSLEN